MSPIDRRGPDRDRRAGFRVSTFYCSVVHTAQTVVIGGCPDLLSAP